jgi:hypothetical protein
MEHVDVKLNVTLFQASPLPRVSMEGPLGLKRPRRFGHFPTLAVNGDDVIRYDARSVAARFEGPLSKDANFSVLSDSAFSS